MYDFLVFALVGFFAQLIDGALGMGYGVISSVCLLASGVPPSHTSASVHAAAATHHNATARICANRPCPSSIQCPTSIGAATAVTVAAKAPPNVAGMRRG